MPANNESVLKLNFESTVKPDDVKNIELLSTALERLDNIKLTGLGAMASSLTSLTTSLNTLSGVNLSNNLGDGILNLVNSINRLENVDTISTDVASRLANGFKQIAEATQAFEGNTARIPAGTATLVNALKSLSQIEDIPSDIGDRLYTGFESIARAVSVFKKSDMKNVQIPQGLGAEIGGLVSALTKLNDIPDISSVGDRLKTGFQAIADAAKAFPREEFENIRVPANLGRSVDSLAQALIQMNSIPAMSKDSATNLVEGFKVIAEAVRAFDGIAVKIPVTLGKGVAALVEATNNITEVKDITIYTDILKKNFETIAAAVAHFKNIDNTNLGGIAQLVTALNQLNKVKPINNTVVENAKKLAQAINVLDKSVTADAPRLQQLAAVTKQLSPAFNQASTGAKHFGGSLKLINFAAFISLARQAINTIQRLFTAMKQSVSKFSSLENASLFFGQALQGANQHVYDQVAALMQLGAVDQRYADSISTLTQMYKGYGISTEQAANMALGLTNRMFDLSFAIGQNADSLSEFYARAQSIAAQQTRAGYRVGAALTFAGINTYLRDMDSNMESITGKTDMATRAIAQFNTFINATSAAAGQFGRELNIPAVRLNILQNQLNILVQSIGRMLAPLFLQLAKYALIALQVIVRVIDAIVRLFGGEGFALVDFSEMFKSIQSSASGVGGAAQDTADGLNNAAGAAKELKKTISGIDQVFTINDEVSGGGGLVDSLGGLADLKPVNVADLLNQAAMAELTNMFAEIDATAEKFFQKLKEILPIVLDIAAGIAAWKLVSFLTDISKASGLLAGLKDLAATVSIVVGVALIAGAVQDLLKNGLNLTNTILGAVGGLLAGGGIGWKLTHSISGALIGATIGVGVILALMGSISLIKDGFSAGAFGATLLGAVVAAFGLIRWLTPAYTLGATTVLSLVIGAGVAIAIGGISFLNDNVRSNDIIGGIMTVLGAAMAGAGIGFIVGGPVGAGVGAIIGLAVGLTISIAMVEIKQQQDLFNAAITDLKERATISLTEALDTIALGIAGFSEQNKIVLDLIEVKSDSSQKVKDLALDLQNLSDTISANGQPVASNLQAMAESMMLLMNAISEDSANGFALVREGLGGAFKTASDIGVKAIGDLIVKYGELETAISGKHSATIKEIEDLTAQMKLLPSGSDQWNILNTRITELTEGLLYLADIPSQAKLSVATSSINDFINAINSGTIDITNFADFQAQLGTLSQGAQDYLKELVTVRDNMLMSLEQQRLEGLFYGEDVSVIDELIKAVNDNYNAKKSEFDSFITTMFDGIGASMITQGSQAMQSAMDMIAEQGLNVNPLAIQKVGADFKTEYADKVMDEIVLQFKLSAEKKQQWNDMWKSVDANIFDVKRISDMSGGMVFAEILTDDLVSATTETMKAANFAPSTSAMLTSFKNALGADAVIAGLKASGVDVAKGLEEGINKYTGWNLYAMKDNMIEFIRKSLDSHSPARVTIPIGEDVAAGIEQGANTYVFLFTPLAANALEKLLEALKGTGAFTVGAHVGNQVGIDIMSALNTYKFDFTLSINNIRAALTFDATDVGRNIAQGVQRGINNSSVDIRNYTNRVKDAFTNSTQGFTINSPSKWGHDMIGLNIGAGVVNGLNDSRVNIAPFKNSIDNELQKIDAEMQFHPTIDTARLNGDISASTAQLNANVSGDYSYSAEGTRAAVEAQTAITEQLLAQLVQAVEDGKYITMDGEKVAQITRGYQRDMAVRRNRV